MGIENGGSNGNGEGPKKPGKIVDSSNYLPTDITISEDPLTIYGNPPWALRSDELELLVQRANQGDLSDSTVDQQESQGPIEDSITTDDPINTYGNPPFVLPPDALEELMQRSNKVDGDPTKND